MRRRLVIVAIAVGLVGAAGGVALWLRADARQRVSTEARPPVPNRSLVLRSPDGIEAFAYAPDGRTLLTAGKQGLRLWDAVTGNEIRMLVAGQEMTAVAFAPDGRTVISAQRSGEVRRWDATSGAQVGEFTAPPPRVASLVFSPDGRTLAGGSRDGAVQLWDAGTGRALRTLTGAGPFRFKSPPTFSADGRRIARATETVNVWDTTTGEVVERRSFGPRRPANAAAFGPDGDAWAVAGYAWLRLESTATDPRELAGHEGEITAIAFAPDRRSLATVGEFYDNSARLWDVESGRQIRLLCAKCGRFHQVAFGPDGRTVAAASEPDELFVWSI
jgi:WD40 repeat protein